jgi:hypothetical protein
MALPPTRLYREPGDEGAGGEGAGGEERLRYHVLAAHAMVTRVRTSWPSTPRCSTWAAAPGSWR